MVTETQWWSMLFMDCWQDMCVSCHKLTRVWCVWEQRCLEWNKSQVYVQARQYYITKLRRFNIYIYHIAGSACGQYKANPVFWLAIWAHLACSRLPSLILCKKKWTYKVSNFCIMPVIKLQKEAEHSQNRKNLSNIFGLIMLQTQLASFPGSRNYFHFLSFLILMKAKCLAI